MNDKNYHKLGVVLQNTLDGIQRAHDLGLWVEVVTLVVPGFNDSNEELWEAARFLSGVSPDIPWHVTAFHKDYKMTEPENTPGSTLLRAAKIGREARPGCATSMLATFLGGWTNTRIPCVPIATSISSGALVTSF